LFRVEKKEGIRIIKGHGRRSQKKESNTIGPEEGESECGICLGMIEPGVNCCMTNCCIPHAFHTSRLIEHAVKNHRKAAVACPMCRADLFTYPDARSYELLRLVTLQDWDAMSAFIVGNPDAKFDKTIKVGDYPHDANLGMMPLHFAIRDHAPLVGIEQILEAYPEAKTARENSGLAPLELLQILPRMARLD
jgi:hypothetical protein